MTAEECRTHRDQSADNFESMRGGKRDYNSRNAALWEIAAQLADLNAKLAGVMLTDPPRVRTTFRA